MSMGMWSGHLGREDQGGLIRAREVPQPLRRRQMSLHDRLDSPQLLGGEMLAMPLAQDFRQGCCRAGPRSLGGSVTGSKRERSEGGEGLGEIATGCAPG